MSDLAKFRQLGLSQKMLESLGKKGFEEPTPIQELTIPFLLKKEKDVIGQAQTGTGKTGAFAIPLIENIAPQDVKGKIGKPKAVILAPTRELAIQVAEEMNSLSYDRDLKIVAIYGGQPIERQISRIQRGVDIVVGTPGRILDHLERKTLDFAGLEYVVLDEADEMLNMGFVEDIEKILKGTNSEKRMLLFSATMPPNILKLAKSYMSDYEIVSVKKDEIAKKNINQIYFEVSHGEKFEALYRIIDIEEYFYGVVFCRTKIDAQEISDKLLLRGCRVEALHGDVSQSQREKILSKFKSKKITILVATDVAARGIDVDHLTHVINYSLPQDPESYVHRIGRTGRAGRSGTAITLITPSEYRKLTNIKKVAKADIQKQQIPDASKVVENKKERIKTAIFDILQKGDFVDLKELSQEILAGNEAVDVVSSLLKHSFKEELSEKSYPEFSEKSSRDCNQKGPGRRLDRKGVTRLFVAKGRNDGMNAAQVAKFIEEESKVNSRNIFDINVMNDFSFVTTSFDEAGQILQAFSKKKGKSGRSIVSKAKTNNGGSSRGNGDRGNSGRSGRGNGGRSNKKRN